MFSANTSSTPTRKQKKLKKHKRNIRRLNKSETFSDFSDTELLEPKYRSRNSTLNSTDTAISECDIRTSKSFSPLELHNSTLTNTASCFDNETECCSFSNTQREGQNDLNTSLSNLYLSASPGGSCKQLLSPPKLKTVMQNPWTAGGFWHNSYPCGSPPPAESGESRSSSQSSGFISQTQEKQCFNSLPASRANSCHSAEDKVSVLSEPMFVNDAVSLPRMGKNPKMRNTFFPTLKANQTLYIQAGAPVTAGDLYMRNRDFWGSGASSAVAKDICNSGLFKNPELLRHNQRSRFSYNEM